MIIAPVIFFTVVLGIAGAGDLKKVGRVGGKGLLYFEILTTIAIFFGLLTANFIRPGAGISPVQSSAGTSFSSTHIQNFDWTEFIVHIVPSNIVKSFADGDIIQILFFGILFSFALKGLGTQSVSITGIFEKLNKVMFNILHIIMKVSPVGAFGGMAYTIGKFGFISLIALGKLLLTFYLTGLIFIFILLNLIMKYYGLSLWKLLIYIKEEILIVFGSSSSEPVLPNIIEKLATAGCDRSVVGLIVPTGYSFNLDGSSIYLSMSVVFLAQVFNVPLSIGQQIGIMGILMITSKGAAGVTGSGFLVLSSTMVALKVIPMEGLALLIGVDRFMSQGRALINVIGNSVATIVIAKSENAVNIAQYKELVEKQRIVFTGK